MKDIYSIQFGINIALAFVLYAIRRALKMPKRFLPILAIVIGVFLSWIQGGTFSYQVILRGIQYALYGVGAVETFKYTFTKHGNNPPSTPKHGQNHHSGKKHEDNPTNSNQEKQN